VKCFVLLENCKFAINFPAIMNIKIKESLLACVASMNVFFFLQLVNGFFSWMQRFCIDSQGEKLTSARGVGS